MSIISGIVLEATINGVPFAADTDGLEITPSGYIYTPKDLPIRKRALIQTWMSAKLSVQAHAINKMTGIRLKQIMEQEPGQATIVIRTTIEEIICTGCALTQMPTDDKAEGSTKLEISCEEIIVN